MHDAAFARAGCHQVQDHHRVVLLTVAVDAPHALLQASGIPGNVVIDHDPAHLQVDAFTGCIGSDQVFCAAFIQRFAERIDRSFTLAVIHTAVDLDDLPGETHTFQAAHQKGECIAVLGEYDQLFVCKLGIT
jgi:hypothetical protein